MSRWLLLAACAALVTSASRADAEIGVPWLVDLFQTCAEDRWIAVPGVPDLEVSCFSRRKQSADRPHPSRRPDVTT